ncbi:hypothetical protein HYN59_05100 [Flavobacterium album]|uniref:Uncharacterized protein n=2 Tax=Flavobacterium album TaxID=2175091 RepID=A0A2S1QVT9_9FLAO|nr:hypothetical protein HYN59_05100 [Flavobacterium album]
MAMAEDDGNGGVVIVRSYLEGGLFNIIPDGYYFEHYDANMKLIKDYKYEFKNGSIIGICIKGDNVNMIAVEYDKKDKAYIYSAIPGNIKNLSFTTPKELFRIEGEDMQLYVSPYIGNSWDPERDRYDKGAQIIFNNDKTAFAISIDINDRDERKEMRKIYVYDANLDLKIEHTFRRDIKDRKFIFENIDISPDGSVAYLLGKAYTKEARKKNDGGKYQYELTRITANGSNTKVFDTEEHYAKSLQIVFRKNTIACLGFYSDRKDNRFKGVCYFDMDPVTLETKIARYNPFTDQFMTDKYGTKKGGELKDILFKNVSLTDDNSIILNAEEYYLSNAKGWGPQGIDNMYTSYSYTYNYDDIVCAKIADNGDLVWARNINKRQSTMTNDQYVSYSSMVKGDDTYFFINAGDKLKKLSKDRIQFSQKAAKKSNLNIIHINKDGDIDFKELLDDKNNEVPFMVANGATTKTGNSIYFLGQLKKKKQLLKLTL